jgi:hypothetical protein
MNLKTCPKKGAMAKTRMRTIIPRKRKINSPELKISFAAL